MNSENINFLESTFNSETKEALERFSRLANKSTLAGHPLDEERWFRFLYLVHKTHKQIDVELVIRSLKDLGWSDDDAYRLGLQFEFAQSLLSFVNE
ncbi:MULTISPECIES: hypothetical protein [Psychrobacter]|jgi:hypothetical protein|uniref:Uncharacterized protein n=1 Tax=Psychrobacter faecalis TaxID=180588 RepID=A0ABT9HGJ5_9GAMM|nr:MULTISPECIES: hypothetical protein [Psychrobacter]MBP8817224.1 hypothetical protein [Psychrobacter sp.]MDP4544843.1 hypothetical protein [Psychrobacter faecalis]WLW66074.1 hypothetical protein RAH45_11725 [Psychrobacter sp. van23A]HCR87409.1 hypothetical protein [Psychrobacter sp.]